MFYLKCGEMVGWEVVSEGESPHQTHTAVWQYEKGVARFDGEKWDYQLS